MSITVITIEPGPVVLCDLCNKDYTTDDTTKGGFQFGSKAICPECAVTFMPLVKKHNEEEYILNTARPNETFKRFVYRIRGNETH